MNGASMYRKAEAPEAIENIIRRYGPCTGAIISQVLLEEFNIKMSPKEVGHLIRNQRNPRIISKVLDKTKRKTHYEMVKIERKRSSSNI